MKRRRTGRQVDEQLASALPTVTEAYVNFVQDARAERESDPKLFAARHTAAKTALSHIEQLMKVAGMSEEEATQHLNAATSPLSEARQEIEQEMPCDDPGEPG